MILTACSSHNFFLFTLSALCALDYRLIVHIRILSVNYIKQKILSLPGGWELNC